MAGEETIGRASIELGADGSQLGPEMAAATAKAQGELARANRRMERAQASATRSIQRQIDKINAQRPTDQMRFLEQAVLRLGGTSKLTSAQLKRVTAEVTRLSAAGAKVPESLQAVQKSTTGIGAAFRSLTSGGGISGALAAIGPAGLAAGAGMTALAAGTTKAVTALRQISERGTAVIGVRNSFRGLAKDSEELLASSREATGGMISDFRLMQAANKGLLLELPITADEMGILGQTAIKLGAAMNVGPNEALNDLITGLGRGSAAILDNLGINVKAADAYKRYADAIGKTTTELTGQEKKLAVYQAALESAEKAIARIADGTDTAGAGSARLSAAWDNVKDTFAAAITESTTLTNSFNDLAAVLNTVAGAMRDPAFGEFLENLIKTGAFIGSFGLSEVGRDWERQFEEMKDASDVLQKIRKDNAGIFAPPELAIPGGPTQEELEAEEEAAKAVEEAFKEAEKAAADFQKQLDQWSGAKAQAELDKLGKVIETLGVDGVADVDALITKIEQLQKQGADVPKDSLLGRILSGKKIEIPELLDADALNLGDVKQGLDDIGLSLVKTGLDAQEEFNAIARSAQEAGLNTEGISLALKGVGASGDQVKVALKDINASSVDWEQNLANIANIVRGMPGPLGKIGDVIAGITTGLSGVMASLKQIGSGGGGIGGFLANLSGIGGVVGSVLGALGPLTSKIGGLFKGAQEEVNDLRDEFFEAEGGFEAFSAKMAQVSSEDWAKKIFDAQSVEEFNALVKEAKGLLDTQTQAQEALKAATDRYGFTIEELGPAMQRQELEAQAGQLLQDFKLLTASGIGVNTVLKRMGPNLNEFLQTAIKTGQAVPEAMRPMIEAAIKNGQILDENGEAYASAEEAGITFAQSMSEQFTTLIGKIDAMVNALLGINDVSVSPTVSIPNVPNIPGGGGPPSERLPRAAKGALITKPTAMIAGDDGPELFLPMKTPQALANFFSNIPTDVAGQGGGGGDTIQINMPISENPWQSSEGRLQLRRHTLTAVERETSKHLAARVRAGRA